MKKVPRKKATRKKAAATKAPRKKATAKAEPETPYRGPSGGDPLDYCPACQEFKPLSEWALASGERLPRGAFVCTPCRRAKAKPRVDYLPELSGRSRKLLRDLVSSRSITDTAKRNNLSVAQVTRLIRGRTDKSDREGELLRAAWQEMLVLEGLDLMTIARITRLTLHATKPYWNKTTKEWDFFPDHIARIQAARWLVRMQGADPTVPKPPDTGRQGGAAIVVLDIGTSKEDPAPDAFTVDVTPTRPKRKRVAAGGGKSQSAEPDA